MGNARRGLGGIGKGRKEMTVAEMIAALRAKRYLTREPESIRIGGINVPKPLMTPPPLGTRYWCAMMDEDAMAYAFTWNGDRYDRLVLKRGMLHLTEENALAHAKALIQVSGGCV